MAIPNDVLQGYLADLAKGVSTTGYHLSQVILHYCQNNLNRKVGDGECATLLADAVAAAHAQRFPPFGPNADYVWGTLVATVLPGNLKQVSAIAPGDMLQLHAVSFAGKKTFPNGAWESWSISAPHHSSVVNRVADHGALLEVLEQNVNGRRTVGKGYYNFPDLKSGWIKVYRAR